MKYGQMTDLLDLIEEAEHAERLAKRQRELVQAESPAITAELYCLRTYPVIEITLAAMRVFWRSSSRTRRRGRIYLLQSVRIPGL
jgi:hypothetical protein